MGISTIKVCVSHKQTLRIVKLLGESHDETMEKSCTVDDQPSANHASDSSWYTERSDIEK